MASLPCYSKNAGAAANKCLHSIITIGYSTPWKNVLIKQGSGDPLISTQGKTLMVMVILTRVRTYLEAQLLVA